MPNQERTGDEASSWAATRVTGTPALRVEAGGRDAGEITIGPGAVLLLVNLGRTALVEVRQPGARIERHPVPRASLARITGPARASAPGSPDCLHLWGVSDEDERVAVASLDGLGRYAAQTLHDLLTRAAPSRLHDALLEIVVNRCLSALADAKLRTVGHTPLQPYKLRRVKAHIEENLVLPITLEEMAALAGMSRFHFSRCFKAAVGRSPHSYLIERRLERCRDLLSGTTLALAQVALEAGFASQAHMTSTFRSAFGQTPRQFRKSGTLSLPA